MLQKRAIETYKSMYTFFCNSFYVHQCESPSRRTAPTLTHTHTINHRTQQPLEADTGHRRIIGDVSVTVLQGGYEEPGFLVRHRVTQVGHDLSEFTAEHHLVAFTVEALEHL